MGKSFEEMFLEKMVNSEDWMDREIIAASRDTPAEYLTKLSEDDYWFVRYAVATNPSTLEKDVIKLTEDKDLRVCEAHR